MNIYSCCLQKDVNKIIKFKMNLETNFYRLDKASDLKNFATFCENIFSNEKSLFFNKTLH